METELAKLALGADELREKGQPAAGATDALLRDGLDRWRALDKLDNLLAQLARDPKRANEAEVAAFIAKVRTIVDSGRKEIRESTQDVASKAIDMLAGRTNLALLADHPVFEDERLHGCDFSQLLEKASEIIRSGQDQKLLAGDFDRQELAQKIDAAREALPQTAPFDRAEKVIRALGYGIDHETSPLVDLLAKMAGLARYGDALIEISSDPSRRKSSVAAARARLLEAVERTFQSGGDAKSTAPQNLAALKTLVREPAMSAYFAALEDAALDKSSIALIVALGDNRLGLKKDGASIGGKSLESISSRMSVLEVGGAYGSLRIDRGELKSRIEAAIRDLADVAIGSIK